MTDEEYDQKLKDLQEETYHLWDAVFTPTENTNPFDEVAEAIATIIVNELLKKGELT